MKIGLDYNQTLDIPYGELMSMIAVEQIKSEGFKPVFKRDDDDILPNLR